MKITLRVLVPSMVAGIVTGTLMLMIGLLGSCGKSVSNVRAASLELSGTIKTHGSARSATLVIVLDRPITDPEINSPQAKEGDSYPALSTLAIAGRFTGELYEKQGSKVLVRGEIFVRDSKNSQQPKGFTQMFNYDPRIKYQLQVSWYRVLEALPEFD